MLRVITILMICGAASVALGQQFPSEFWHTGKAILTSGDTLEGDIKYDLDNDLIQIQTSKRILTYSARKLFYFQIFDVTVDTYRQFYVLPYKIKYDYEAPLIFEVIFEGKLTLLARESIVNQTTNYNSYYWAGGNYTRQALIYDYYFLDQKGEITYFTKKRKDLIDILHKRGPQIKSFIKKNNLKVDVKRDLARIMAYYNALLD